MNTNKEFKIKCDTHAPKSRVGMHCLWAFLVGGAICFIGQWIAFLFQYLGIGEKEAYLSVTLVFIVPTPAINPSLLVSIALLVTAFENPVTGTSVPAPARVAILSKNPREVATEARTIKTRVTER